ncbi:tetraspanin-33b isoform X2 [Polypterus senegalus]|uniref:tetraspanin-33b isoform X2 n=1 Tax=Polypterus senegalus TaxID=55291 RepID=UPI0019637934|nr:tetraspanin-33b isoform X2 [Polypterus senegalus]
MMPWSCETHIDWLPLAIISVRLMRVTGCARRLGHSLAVGTMDRPLSFDRAETFSFINPWIRYFLFFFSFLFWVLSLVIIAIGVYAKIQKATDTVRDTFLVDPAIILITVGVVMFFITFCGCIGALRENIKLLRVIPGTFGKFVKKAIVHYRDDIDLQNLIDYIQKEFLCCGWNNFTDWSQNLYFNCTLENPSRERCGVPYSCCAAVPGEVVVNTMCGFGVQNLKYIEAVKFIYPEGCAEKATHWMETHLLLVGALALGLALPQVLCVYTSASYLWCVFKKVGRATVVYLSVCLPDVTLPPQKICNWGVMVTEAIHAVLHSQLSVLFLSD